VIVIAAPRCGGTKFTQDLAVKHTLHYVGEVTPIYITNYLTSYRPSKDFIHELSQSMHTEDKWIDALTNPDKYAILLNGHDISMNLPRADFILLRRSLPNIIASWIKYLGWNEQFYKMTIDPNVKRYEVNLLVHDIYAMCLYSLKTGKQITWYEDHFQTPDYEITAELKQYLNIIKRTSLDKLFVKVGGNSL
jgi:hypothetical protein